MTKDPSTSDNTCVLGLIATGALVGFIAIMLSGGNNRSFNSGTATTPAETTYQTPARPAPAVFHPSDPLAKRRFGSARARRFGSQPSNDPIHVDSLNLVRPGSRQPQRTTLQQQTDAYERWSRQARADIYNRRLRMRQDNLQRNNWDLEEGRITPQEWAGQRNHIMIQPLGSEP